MSANILVIHANGAYSYAKRIRAQAAVDSDVAYWKTNSRDVLIMRKSTDDTPARGYEYRGTLSGGAIVMQLCKLRNRRARGRHITMPEDSLWRPERKSS